MRRFLLTILLCATVTAAFPQKPQQKNTAKTKTTATTKKRTTQAKPVDKKTQLRQQQEAMAKARKQQQQKAVELNKSIRSNLDSVLILDNQIGRQQKSIDSLNADIKALTTRIDTLTKELRRLQRELAERKSKYAKAMVHAQRNKNVQEKLMFIFSAKNLEQAIRRMRYIKEYSTFQRAQGQIIKEKQAEVHRKQNELLEAKTKLEIHRVALEEQRKLLESAKDNCQKKVQFLNQNLSTVQQQIQDYKKKEADLNAQIDRIIQQEIAEAKRKAEEERKRREEEAKRKAAAEAKRLAEAKAARERAEAEKRRAEEAARNATNADEKRAAKEEIKRAESTLKTAKTEEKAAEKAYTKAEKRGESETAWSNEDAADRRLSSSFTANKGRLPMPITGSYSVVGHYGTYTVAGLKNVTLDNKGIDIRGQQGAQARAVFDGVVSQVFQYGGYYIVMLRHGSYISVYSGLASVSVSKGARVSTRQALGAVGKDDSGNIVLHFQLRQESSRLNPEQWVR